MSRIKIIPLCPQAINPTNPISAVNEMTTLQTLYALRAKIDECISMINGLAYVDPIDRTEEMTKPVGVDTDGKLYTSPDDVVPAPTAADNQKRLVVLNGHAAWADLFRWKQITLPFASWVNNHVTISDSDIEAGMHILAGATESGDNSDIANEAGIKLRAIGNGYLTFSCESVPDENVTFDLWIAEQKGATT